MMNLSILVATLLAANLAVAAAGPLVAEADLDAHAENDLFPDEWLYTDGGEADLDWDAFAEEDFAGDSEAGVGILEQPGVIDTFIWHSVEEPEEQEQEPEAARNAYSKSWILHESHEASDSSDSLEEQQRRPLGSRQGWQAAPRRGGWNRS